MVGTWRGAGTALSIVLAYAFFAPLLSAYTPLPDLSGSEAGLAGVVWILSILGNRRVEGIDGIIATVYVWAVVSALATGTAVTAGLLQAALLATPFIAAKLLLAADEDGRRIVRKTIVVIVVAQVVMLLIQLVTYAGIDDLKGTFVGTQYGEHVASLVVMVGAVAYAMHRKSGALGVILIGVGMLLAFLADSKVALVYFLIVGVAYLAVGSPLTKVRSLFRPLWRVGVTVAGVFAIWAVYTGAFGGIALSGYIEQTAETGGGKVAVVNTMLDTDDFVWANENMLVGAGPAQTVSRTAGLTVPTRVSPVPPAERLGIEPAKYQVALQSEAAGYGYVASSSFTSASSSLIGLFGDLGIGGLVIYGVGFVWVFNRICKASSWRSWPALAWLGVLVPGALGEWLEFPPAMMFLAVVALWMVSATPQSGDSEVGRGGADAGHDARKLEWSRQVRPRRI